MRPRPSVLPSTPLWHTRAAVPAWPALARSSAGTSRHLRGDNPTRYPGAAVIVPPRSGAVPIDTAEIAPTRRDGHLQCTADDGRMAWHKPFGYDRRALVGSDVSRRKRVIGDGLRSRSGRAAGDRGGHRSRGPERHARVRTPGARPYRMRPRGLGRNAPDARPMRLSPSTAPVPHSRPRRGQAPQPRRGRQRRRASGRRSAKGPCHRPSIDFATVARVAFQVRNYGPVRLSRLSTRFRIFQSREAPSRAEPVCVSPSRP